jgi:hypothetical protein
MSSYYKREMDKIDFHEDFNATVQFKCLKDSTKWMNVNKESAKYIIQALKKYIKEA